MAHIPTTESYLKKVVRIAKELDISMDKASITCYAFDFVFSDEWSRQAIFGMIEQLDESASRRGEPAGLIINYGVEVGLEGIRVSRYADEISAGEVVNLTPPNRARIFLQINDDFPTKEVLGPMVVNRPVPMSVPGVVATGDFSSDGRDGLTDSENANSELPSLAKEGWQPASADGVVCSSDGITQLEPPTELPKTVICLGPIRLRFEERFPIVSRAVYPTKRTGARSCLTSFGGTAPDGHLGLPPWAALQAGTPAFQSKSALQSTSGLSPPPTIGERGHSGRKMSHGRGTLTKRKHSWIFENVIERTSRVRHIPRFTASTLPIDPSQPRLTCRSSGSTLIEESVKAARTSEKNETGRTLPNCDNPA